MEDIKREIYEMDAIEAKQAELFNNRMIEKGYEKCNKCEHWVEDRTYGLCESCIDEILDDTTLDEVMEYASTLHKDNELVLYTEYLFTADEVISILKDYAETTESFEKGLFKKGIKEYIECDITHYLDYLDKKGDL